MPSSARVEGSPPRARATTASTRSAAQSPVDGVRPADGPHAGLGEAEVAHLARLDELLDDAGDVLDRHLPVDAVLVQRSIVSTLSRSYAPSMARRTCTGRRRPGLRPSSSKAKPNFVAMTAPGRHGREGLPDELLVGETAVTSAGSEGHRHARPPPRQARRRPRGPAARRSSWLSPIQAKPEARHRQPCPSVRVSRSTEPAAPVAEPAGRRRDALTAEQDRIVDIGPIVAGAGIRRRAMTGVSNMVDVVLFHHVQGLDRGRPRFADELRWGGHAVADADLFDGQRFATVAATGSPTSKATGDEELRERIPPGRRPSSPITRCSPGSAGSRHRAGAAQTVPVPAVPCCTRPSCR